jgi:hypothetical protein
MILFTACTSYVDTIADDFDLLSSNSNGHNPQGRSRKHAFKIGAEIASAVTAANPRPVTLKMEKVADLCLHQL